MGAVHLAERSLSVCTSRSASSPAPPFDWGFVARSWARALHGRVHPHTGLLLPEVDEQSSGYLELRRHCAGRWLDPADGLVPFGRARHGRQGLRDGNFFDAWQSDSDEAAAPGSALSNFLPGQVASERFERKGLQIFGSGVFHLALSVVPAELRKGPVHPASSRRPIAPRQSSYERITKNIGGRLVELALLHSCSEPSQQFQEIAPRFGGSACTLRFGQHGVSPLVRLDLQSFTGLEREKERGKGKHER